MFLLLFFFFLLSIANGHCVRDETYWLNCERVEWPSEVRESVLCGQNCYSIFTSNYRNQSLWNITFREITVALLNNYTEHYGDRHIYDIINGTKNVCNTSERFKMVLSLEEKEVMEHIQKYNRGLTSHLLCQEEEEQQNTDPMQFYIRIGGIWLLLLTLSSITLHRKIYRLTQQQQQ